ncbi:MAG: MOSC domain-containing protein [Acidimicrobiales bacterium]
MTTKLGEVAALWRYPVKSLGGEALSEAVCDRRGIVGDRRWAVRGSDGKIGSGKSTRRFRRMPGLLSFSARLDDDGVARVQPESGEAVRVDDPRAAALVGAVVGEPVTLEEETDVSHFDDAALHVLSTSSLAWLRRSRPDDQVEAPRFRPNVVVDVRGASRPEDGWIGHILQIGALTVGISGSTGRCVMVTMRQPGLGFAPGILGELSRGAGGLFGVYGRVLEEGRVQVGDDVSLVG